MISILTILNVIKYLPGGQQKIKYTFIISIIIQILPV